jgi:hypothetical protein
MNNNCRQITGPNELVDILSDMKGKRFISFGYITAIKLNNVPQVKKFNSKTNQLQSYTNYKTLQPMINYYMNTNYDIAGIIKFVVYNQQFHNATEIHNDYFNYKDKANIIRDKYNVPRIGDDEHYKSTIDYGKGGNSVYNKSNPDKMGHIYMPQNVYHGEKTKRAEYYLIDTQGNIIGDALPASMINRLFSAYPNNKNIHSNPEVQKLLNQIGGYDSGYTALQKLNAADDKIIKYLTEINELKMNYKNFEYSSIVYMVGTCNKEKFYFINNQFIHEIDGFRINPQAFIELAKKRYQNSIQELQQLEKMT